MSAEILARLSEERLDVQGAIADVSLPAAGGLAVFIGTVRASPGVAENEGREVVRLEYEAHPKMAENRLTEIARDASERWEVIRVAAIHRVGACDVGEPTVVVACSAEHRGAALDACRWIIDEIKTTVPIWKREVYSDGSSWVGAEGAT